MNTLLGFAPKTYVRVPKITIHLQKSQHGLVTVHNLIRKIAEKLIIDNIIA